MSEPLTSNEIEDVLSSIRRLVSDELRPMARAAVAAQPASALLLTPALRVVPDAGQAVEEPDLVEDLPPPLPEDRLDDPADNAAEADEAWAIAPPTDEYEEQMAGEAGFAPSADETVLAGPTLASASVEDWESGADVLWSAPGVTEEHDFDDAPEAASAAAPQGHWSAQEVPQATWAQDEPDWVEAEPPAFVAHPRKASLASDPLARAWADRAEAEVRAGLGETVPPPKAEAPKAAEPPHAAASPEVGIFDGNDPELDEEALRDIVRDIIREELSGTLGERITRNVRKLVRVEINRALTAREFE